MHRADNPSRLACVILHVQLFPHSDISEFYVTTKRMGIHDHNSQTSKLSSNFVIYVAMFGREFGSIPDVGKIFAKDGPIPGFAIFGVV